MDIQFKIKRDKDGNISKFKARLVAQGFTQAMKSPHHTEWLEAIRSELKSLIKAGTWRYAHKPTEANLVGCRWIFKIKRNKDGNISKFKARQPASWRKDSRRCTASTTQKHTLQ